MLLSSGVVAYCDEIKGATTLNELIGMFDSSSCRECHDQI